MKYLFNAYLNTYYALCDLGSYRLFWRPEGYIEGGAIGIYSVALCFDFCYLDDLIFKNKSHMIFRGTVIVIIFAMNFLVFASDKFCFKNRREQKIAGAYYLIAITLVGSLFLYPILQYVYELAF